MFKMRWEEMPVRMLFGQHCRARTCPFAWSSATAYSRSLAMSVQLNAAACRATSACAKRSRVRGGKELLPERGRGRSHVRPQAPAPQEVRRNQKLKRKIGCGRSEEQRAGKGRGRTCKN